MRLSFTRGSLPLITWAVLLLAAVVVAAMQTSRDDTWVRSNVFELLPAADYDPLQEQATRVVDAELGTRLLFFVGHEDRDVAKQAVGRLGETLSELELLESVTIRADETEFAAMGELYYPLRSRMLSDAQLEQIENNIDAIEAAAISKLYSPFGAAGDLATDPFFLFADSLQALQPAGSALQLEDGHLWAQREGRHYVLAMANLVSPSLSIGEQEELATYINSTLAEMQAEQPQLDVLKTGFSFYAHHATQSAKSEISTIGVGSLIGLLLLVLSTFRSLRPLTLIVLSILAGCAIALAITLSVFGFVHLFTLVFGASLIGVSVDYSFHYIADDAFGDDAWTPAAGLRNIFPGITLGLATSILAYLALTVAPFPGLQQLAVFSSAGLIGAYLTLIAMTHLLRKRFVLHRQSIVLHFATRYLQAWRARSRGAQAIVAVALVVLIGVGALRLDVNDDVRMLQSQPPELARQESVIQEMLGIAQAGTFLLVSGDDDESLLREEERIRVRLDEMIGEGLLDSYQAVSRWVPSLDRQEKSVRAWNELMTSRLLTYFETIEVDEEDAAQALVNLTVASPTLDVQAWLQHPASAQFRNLWLDTEGPGSASIILLFGVDDVDTLSEFSVINKGRELSVLFGEYRTRVVQMLAAAYVLILLGLAWRYGLRRAAAVLAPPVLAGLLALALVSLGGGALNLFNFLALILVLGIGIDFTIFVAESRHDLASTMFAITLSALTTILSFGLLSLSSTFAVHSFGITVLIGIACAYLLCPAAIMARRRGNTT
jgi:predicted exporter